MFTVQRATNRRLVHRGSALPWVLGCLALLLLAAPDVHAQSEIVYVESLRHGADGVDGMSGASDTVVSPDGRHVYVAAYASSSIAIFSRDSSLGTLTYVDRVTSSVGGAQMSSVFSVDISPDGKHVYGGSPSSSSVVVFSRDPDTGLLSFVENQLTSAEPFTVAGFISVTVSRDGESVYGVGGSADGLVVFSRDPASGALTYVEEHLDNVGGNLLGQGFSPTASPINNIAVSGDGAFAYVTSTDDDAVTVFARNAETGALTVASTVVDGVDGNDGLDGASSLVMSPDDEFLYVSGQAESSVAIFARNQATGALIYVGKRTQGTDGLTTLAGARSLAVSPDGRYLYVSAITSNSVSVFNRNIVTGELSFATAATNGVDGVESLGSVSGMVTDSLSRNLYAAGQTTGAVVVFRLPIPAVVLGSFTASVDDGGASVVLDAALDVLDADDTHLEGGSVRIVNGFMPGDVLSFTSQGGIAASYDAPSGVLTLSGSATLADYQSILRSVRFAAQQSPPLPDGQTSTREIAFTLFDGDNESADAIVSVTVNGRYSATYMLSYAASANGSIVGEAAQSVPLGGAGTGVTASAAAGYHFVQWSDGSTMNPRTETNVTANVTVTASFAINSYTLSYAAGAHGSVSGATSQSVDHGGSGSAVTAVPAGDYHFVQWSDGSTANPRTDSDVTSNRSVTASFAASAHVVTPSAGPHGSVSPNSPQSVGHGGTVEITVAPVAGYLARIAGSCGGALSGSIYTTAAVTASCTVQVSFVPVFSVMDGDGAPFVGTILSVGAEQQFSASLVPDAVTGTVKRGGDTTLLNGQDIDELLASDAEGGFTFRALRTGEYSLTLVHSSSAQEHAITLRVPARAAWGSQRQLSSAGVLTRARVVLDDLPIEYPVRLPIAVENHMLADLSESDIVEIEAGLSATIAFIPNANAGEISLSFGEGAINARLGGLTVHRTQLRESAEVPLSAALDIVQGDRSDTVVMQDGGPITLSVTTASPVSVDWSESDLALNIRQHTAATVSVDPTQLNGRYRVRALISETQAPHRTANVELVLRVAAPADMGRYSAYQEFVSTQPERTLAICPGGQFRVAACANEAVRLRMPDGYSVRMGTAAEAASWNSGQFGIAITSDDLEAQSTALDAGHEHLGPIVDFEVYDLEMAGESVPVVVELPSSQTIPPNAKWRKYVRETGWRDFVQNDANALHSAPRTDAGECPWVGADAWQAGLLTGNGCVRLTLEDGGPNDADAEADAVIRDPGTLAVASSAPGERSIGSKNLKSGGGSFGVWCIAVLALLALLRRQRAVAVPLLALLTAGTASAENAWYDDVYVGGQIGWAHTDISSAELNARMSAQGIPGSASISDERSSWRAIVGYRLTDIVALEAGYTDLGSIDTRFTDLPDSVTVRDLRGVRPGTGHGAEMTVVGGHDFTSHLRGQARAGALRWRSRHALGNGGSERSTGTDLTYGVALVWRFNALWSGQMSWDRYEIERDATQVIGVGVLYRTGSGHRP